jgi:glucosamine--fructose-6-phosphate aminotransferase (isomerizing)
MTVEDRVEAFRADIAASPEALARLLDAPPSALDEHRRICLTGLGSSRFAADVVAGSWRAQGRTAWSELASGRERTRPAADLTLIAISASGGTPEVIEAARRHKGVSRVIAVTERPASALAQAADEVVLLHAGPETSGIACRTFRGTLAALAMLGGTRPDDLGWIPDALSDRLPSAHVWAAEAAGAVDGAPAIDVLADGSLLGLAEQTALMLREAPRLPAHAVETADWLHVGVYLAWPGHVVLHVPGSAADEELARTLQARGVQAVTPPPLDIDASRGSIVEAIVRSLDAEVLAATLWGRTSAPVTGPDKTP